MNNMLRARLLRDLPSRKWVVEIPGIMLALNAMVHEPHGFSASMIATGREPALPPDLEGNACTSPSSENPVTYVDMVRQRLALTHQQMTPPPAPVAVNPYHEDDLIFVMTTPPERTSKLAPRWKGPFVVKRVPNAYQVTYEDDMVWRTVHVNHVKPAKTPAGASPSLCHYLPHHRHLLCTSRGIYNGNGQPNLLNQPPLPRDHLNQPPLSQSPPSQPPRLAQPHLPRVGPPHAHQPMKIRLPALSPGHQPLLGGPMRIRGWVNLCGALHGSNPPPCA